MPLLEKRDVTRQKGDNVRDWEDIFRWFHRHPEAGLHEVRTTERIREILEDMGIEIIESPLETGLLAVIRGGKPGHEIALRADIDALPVKETAEISYRSENEGCMHACGHDFHITTVLAAAERLSEIRGQLSGTIWLIFQPAEEVFTGARQVVATGLLKNVKEFWGMHADPDLEPGVIGIHPGPVAASVDRFRVDVNGTGCHGALPHLGKNPLTVLAGLYSALDTYAGRPVSPFHASVVSITQMHGGDTWNVIPPSAFLEGTTRSFYPEDRKAIEHDIRRIVEGYGAVSDTDCILTWTEAHDPVLNDEALSEFAERTAKENGFACRRVPATMTGDDFGYYSLVYSVPGVYLKIGTGKGRPLHHPAFCVDTEAIRPAADYLAELMALRMNAQAASQN